MVVRFYCDRELRVKSRFFKLVEVTTGTADCITAAVLDSFEKRGIPINNIIGYVSDTTNVMFGEHHSVVTNLKEKIPCLFVMKCICHSAHLCASYACEKLPRAIENMVRDIYSYFSHSAKSLNSAKNWQNLINFNTLPMLNLIYYAPRALLPSRRIPRSLYPVVHECKRVL